MVEIRNERGLKQYFGSRTVQVIVPLASRSAMRTIPILGVEFKESASQRGWRNSNILPLFRFGISLINLPRYTEIDETYTRPIIDFVNLKKHLSSDKIFVSNIFSAFGAVAEHILYYKKGLNTGYMAILYSEMAAGYIGDRTGAVWNSISLDATALERGIDLWTQPLWLDDTPEWAVRGWETLASELTKRAPYWRTLVRWYEDRLHGDDWAAAQGRPAIPELEIARASLPDSYWKKGGKAVNEAIARLEAYFWDGAEIDDPVLRRLVGATDPTEYVENSEISDLLTGKSEAEVESGITVVPPPGLPAQTHGPHFELRDGLIDFAPPEHLDPSRNNIQRLRSLVPLLREEALGAIGIFGRNKAHGRIHDTLVTYAGLLEGDVTALNYDLLAGFGVRLQSEEASAQEAVADGLEPAFERSETAALKSVLDLHGPVILATEAGQTFVADAERWKRNPRQEKAFRQSAVKLAAAIESDAIATPLTTAFVKQAAADIGLGPQPERSAVFGVGALRNVSIALIAGAAITLERMP